MNHMKMFMDYIYESKSVSIGDSDSIINALPNTKFILEKINEYFEVYPKFKQIFLSNLWKISKYNHEILEHFLPINLWYEINSYVSWEPYEQFIFRCKVDYVERIESYLTNEIKLNLEYMKNFIDLEQYCKYNLWRYHELKSALNSHKEIYLRS